MDIGFSAVHPFVCFIYYILLIVFSILLFNPAYLMLALIAAAVFLLIHDGGKALSKSWRFYLIMGAAILVINTLVNHRGTNVLFYLSGNPVTLESLIYGTTLALSLLTVLLSFTCYQIAVDSHKFMYLFSSALPKISLLTMMSMRFVPLLTERLGQISAVQKTKGLDITNGPIKKRASDGMQILHILMTWSLEEALQTADSMKARGYGVAVRSSCSRYRMGKDDRLLLAVIITLALITGIGWFCGYGSLKIYPVLELKPFDDISLAFFAVFCLLCFIPAFIEGKDILLWRRLK